MTSRGGRGFINRRPSLGECHLALFPSPSGLRMGGQSWHAGPPGSGTPIASIDKLGGSISNRIPIQFRRLLRD